MFNIKPYRTPHTANIHSVVMNKNIYSLSFLKSHDIIIIAGCDHQILEVNPAAIKSFGYSKDEFLKMDLSQLFIDEKKGVQFLADICKKDHVIHWEYIFKNKEGETFPVLLNADQIDDEGGTFMVVAQNITQLNQEKEDIQTKKEMLLLGKMSQTIAHEIRNPLNNILLGVNQFRTILPEDNEEVKFYFNYLEKNGLRINELINKLLGPTSVFEMKKVNLNLNDLVKEAVNISTDKMKISNIILNLDLSDQPFYFEMDKEKMLMALNNLIINAIESLTKDEGVIYIRTDSKEEKASLMISDNGNGISEANLKKIGQPFFTTKPSGMGLGLINTEQILNAHGIQMEVQSEVSKGSTFTLYF
jgi:PAS domain S-box-containing protein